MIFQRPDKLLLVTGEIFPTARLLEDDSIKTEMTGVEHLGQYVFEMTHAKVEAFKRGEIVVRVEETGGEMGGIEDEEMFEGEGLLEENARILEDDSEEGENMEEDNLLNDKIN